MTSLNIDGSAGVDEPLDPHVWKIAAVVYLGPFMSQLDSTCVNVALPAIQKELGDIGGAAHWIVSAYLLALALSLPLAGFFMDKWGAKRLFLLCFAGFSLASFVCGLAPSLRWLVGARVIQGLCGGMMIPMTQMMMAKAAGKHMARVMGYSAVPTLAAPILGPTLAGAILHVAHWPWLFFINVPIGALAVVLAARILPQDTAEPHHRPFDIRGFALLAPGLALLLYGLEVATQQGGTAYLLTSFALLSWFLWHAHSYGKRALVDLSLFEVSVFARAATTQFFSNAQIFAAQFLIPFYLIHGCALAPGAVGWLLAPTGLGLMCSFPWMGYLTDRFGCRRVSASGAALAWSGTLVLLVVSATKFRPIVAACALFVRGLGQGAIGIPSVSAAYASLPKERLAMATTAMNIVQRLGGPLATTGLSIVLAHTVGQGETGQPHGFVLAFVALLGLHTCSLMAAQRLPRRVAGHSF